MEMIKTNNANEFQNLAEFLRHTNVKQKQKFEEYSIIEDAT
jgi:hypothetical protein